MASLSLLVGTTVVCIYEPFGQDEVRLTKILTFPGLWSPGYLTTLVTTIPLDVVLKVASAF